LPFAAEGDCAGVSAGDFSGAGAGVLGVDAGVGVAVAEGEGLGAGLWEGVV
jgi:hypothetical protein